MIIFPFIYNLKSSMERFIDLKYYFRPATRLNLKSSMERFIVEKAPYKQPKKVFKIQYGEIYSFSKSSPTSLRL